jgi:hypothetical protein
MASIGSSSLLQRVSVAAGGGAAMPTNYLVTRWRCAWRSSRGATTGHLGQPQQHSQHHYSMYSNAAGIAHCLSDELPQAV